MIKARNRQKLVQAMEEHFSEDKEFFKLDTRVKEAFLNVDRGSIRTK